MSAANVFVSVADPDRLIAGDSPLAHFVAAKIQLYRYTSESNARADTSGTLVTTFSLVASTTAAADPNISGPYRFGVYDSSQSASSWYRYRFADSGLANFSQLSDPWQADNRDQWALRDILFEIGDLMGQSIKKGTAATNATVSAVKCAGLFASTLQDARLYEGWWLLCSQDAAGAGAAPEGEEALIASVDTATGIATLDRDLTAAVTANDIVLISSYLQPSSLIRAVNQARERMKVVVSQDIAITKRENRYPAPMGVKSEAQILDIRGVVVDAATNSNREDEFELDYRFEWDGIQGWIYLDEYEGITNVMRVRIERSYRDLEGDLSLMSDTTSAPIEWMRPVGAYMAAMRLREEEPEDQTIAAMVDRFDSEAKLASGTYAPQIIRRVRKKRLQMAGPTWVA